MKMTKLFGGVFLVWAILFAQPGFAQDSLSPAASAPQNAAREKLIKAYYGAYEKKDWNALEQILTTDFTFSSAMDDHISISEYKVRCWPNSANIRKFDLEKLVISGDEAFVTYNGWTTTGKLFRNTEYFNFKAGKIVRNECFFGRGISYPDSGK